MDKDKKLEVFDEADKYRSYFAEDEKELRDVVERLTKLQEVEDNQINMFSAASGAPARGTQHYMFEHVSNAIQIQSQLQSVLKDIRGIKENALNLAIKSANGEDLGDTNAIVASLQALIKENKSRSKSLAKLEKNVEEQQMTEEELDREIEKKLGI